MKTRKTLLMGILAAGILIASGCSGAGKTEKEENGNYGWNAEMGKVQAAESVPSVAEAQASEDACSGDSYSEDSRNEDGTREALVYILEYDGKTMTYDEVEWVSIPSARADELNLTDEGSGFEIYNEKESPVQLSLSEDCVCTVLDWTDNFMPTEVAPEELAELLTERDAPYIPYNLTIEDGRITAVREHYVP